MHFILIREVREFSNGSVCLECDSQCEKMDANTVTCLGQVRVTFLFFLLIDSFFSAFVS